MPIIERGDVLHTTLPVEYPARKLTVVNGNNVSFVPVTSDCFGDSNVFMSLAASGHAVSEYEQIIFAVSHSREAYNFSKADIREIQKIPDSLKYVPGYFV